MSQKEMIDGPMDQVQMHGESLLVVHKRLEQQARGVGTDVASINRILLDQITEWVDAELEIRQAHSRIRMLFDSAPSIMIAVDRDDQIEQWNRQASRLLGLAETDAIGGRIDRQDIPWDGGAVLHQVQRCRHENVLVRLEDVRFTLPDGGEGVLSMTANPIEGRSGMVDGVLLLGTDVTQQRLLERQLAQAQKLEAMGQLAAGIAHEVNTPVQYVGDNLRFLLEQLPVLVQTVSSVRDVLASSPTGEGQAKPSSVLDPLRKVHENVDLEFITKEVPKALAESLDGVERIAQIVRAIRGFSHPANDAKTPWDLNKAIESAVTVCRNEWKYVADMELQLDTDLPAVYCLPGQVQQVMVNLIVNAAHAIDDMLRAHPHGSKGSASSCAAGGVAGNRLTRKGRITISTRQDGDWAEIRVSDTGCGISPEIRAKVFDLFFTTKEHGRGTGQGLPIARAVVEEKHGGTIQFDSVVGQGSTFIVRLPIRGGAEVVKSAGA